MNEVILHNSLFGQSIGFQEIQNRVKMLHKDIKSFYKDEMPIFVVVMNGALRFSDMLTGCFDEPVYLDYLQLASYDGEKSGELKVLMPPKLDFSGKHVLLLEDIVDTGKTLDYLHNSPFFEGAKSIKVASLLLKPKKNKSAYPVDFFGFEIENDFVVGFGLDYNQLGRNLNNIYSKK